MPRLSNDLTIYERHAADWWNPASLTFRSLQQITGYRIKLCRKWLGSIRGKKILDLGCGGGLMSAPLTADGAAVTGVDISRGSLRCARSRCGGSFGQADARALPFPSGVFDAVVIADLLDHIPDYPKVLLEVSRVLKPGGMAYVNTISRTWASWLLAIVVGETARLIPPGTHDYRLFIRPQELAAAALRAGLQQQAVQGEAPLLWKTIRRWAIHFRSTNDTRVAYSMLFQKRTDN